MSALPFLYREVLRFQDDVWRLDRGAGLRDGLDETRSNRTMLLTKQMISEAPGPLGNS